MPEPTQVTPSEQSSGPENTLTVWIDTVRGNVRVIEDRREAERLAERVRDELAQRKRVRVVAGA